jgi:hypothetical protein
MRLLGSYSEGQFRHCSATVVPLFSHCCPTPIRSGKGVGKE